MLNLQTVLKSVKSWGDLEKKLTTTDKQTKGAVFECLTKKYLQFEPRYTSELKHVWLLKEVPSAVAERLKLPKTDQGIDLICETHDGDFWSVQCKFITDTDKKISHRQISTFMSLSFGLSKKISFGLICTTVDDYAAIYRGKPNIGFVLSDEWQKLGKNFFDFARSTEKAKLKPAKVNTPKPHQIEAINSAKRHFIKGKETRGKLVFPCGAGKSLAGYWIARKLAAKSIVVAVPSLALVKQTLETWLAQASADKFSLRWLCVCSDESIGKNDDVAIHTQNLGVPCVTDPVVIAGWLKQNNNQPKVIFTTYQSARMLGEGVRRLAESHQPRHTEQHRSVAAVNLSGRTSTKLRSGDPKTGRSATHDFPFDLGILDEAHKTVGANDKLFSYLLYDKNVKIRRRIFMTATERRYRGNSDDIVSMDDIKLFGTTFAHMSFAHAVKDHILSDYKIVTLAISNQDIAEAVKDNSLNHDGVEARSYAALVALRKAMQKYPIRHAVSFHGSIAKAEDFKKQQDGFSDQHPEFSPLETFHVSGAMPTARRSKIIEEFKTSPSSLITNAKCLTEGVDVPKIDAVLFADPRRSTVDIVQAIGRALRRSPGKKMGYVILPLFTGDATGEAVLASDEFNEIIQTLRKLASNDGRIWEYFRDVSKGKRPRGKLIEFDIDVKATVNFDAETLVRELELRTWNRLAKLNWRPFEEAREFVRGLGLKNAAEWFDFAKSGRRPHDIPANPAMVYLQTGWQSMGDWLATNRIATQKRSYMLFTDARAFVHSLKLQTQEEWQEYCDSGQLPHDVPHSPYRVYATTGWKGVGDWLGTGNVAPKDKIFKDFKSAKSFARSLKLQSSSEWRSYCASGRMPIDIPRNPDVAYKGSGWRNWGDWLGSGRVADHMRTYRTFADAREFVRKLGLGNTAEWLAYCKSKEKPADIPSNANVTYRDAGWKNWLDWLDTDGKPKRKKIFREFVAARNFARSLNLKSQHDWYKYAKSGKKPADIPQSPDRCYAAFGWQGYGDWLGTGKIATQDRQYRTFHSARAYARDLHIRSRQDWHKYCGLGKKPADIPAKPDNTYKSEWRGWPDFLGTAKGKSAKKRK